MKGEFVTVFFSTAHSLNFNLLDALIEEDNPNVDFFTFFFCFFFLTMYSVCERDRLQHAICLTRLRVKLGKFRV